MAKESVFVKFKLEGIHQFYGASKEEFKDVSYLQHPHRHQFGFEVSVEVTHDDRDVEFLQLQHMLRTYLVDKYYDKDISMCNFTGQSCEMLASELVEFCWRSRLKPVEAIVDEDGENGAKHTVTKQKHLKKTGPKTRNEKAAVEHIQLDLGAEKDITMVVGFTGSGKSTLGRLLTELTGAKLIEVSSLIKEILEVRGEEINQNRTLLAQSVTDFQITNAILDEVSKYSGKVVLVGLRQYSVFLKLIEKWGRDRISLVNVSTYPHENAQRLGMPFGEYLSKCVQVDKDLGLTQITEKSDFVYGVDSAIIRGGK